MALGMDLGLAAKGPVIFARAQTSDAWNIRNQTLVLALNNDAVLPPALRVIRDGDRLRFWWPAHPAGFRLQHTPRINAPAWADVNNLVTEPDNRNVVEWPLPGFDPTGFFSGWHNEWRKVWRAAPRLRPGRTAERLQLQPAAARGCRT